MRGRIFFISDPHFHHANMVEGGKITLRSQFATVEAMNAAIVTGINSVVTDHDKLYVLGDITLQRGGNVHALDIVRELKGQKRLILGNHDHFPVPLYLAAGFEKVLGYRELAGIIFSHVPVHPSQFYRYRGNVHGHVHIKDVLMSPPWMNRADPRYINVCVEAVDYVPMELAEIIAHFDGLA